MIEESVAEIVIVLDRSGSMYNIAKDTIGGFNSFLKEQRELPGKAYITLAQFNDKYEIVHDRVDINKVKDMDLKPSGGTAMYDAVAKTIIATKENISKLENKPDVVLFVIITDGEDNESKEFNKSSVKSMIENSENNDKWKFVFLGADIDSFSEGGSIGVKVNSTCNFDKTNAGVMKSYQSVSHGVSSYRTMIHKCKEESLDSDSISKEIGNMNETFDFFGKNK